MESLTTEEHPPRGLEREFLYQAVARQSGLPADMLRAESYEGLVDHAVQEIQSRLFGQDKALARLGAILKARIAERFVGWDESIRTLRATWDRRPIACILAIGPTGIGKTETAKEMANLLFGGRLISLNGSEVGPEAPHGTSMWTGSPPGYVGSDRGGVLTNGLRAHQSGVILVDELEKADRLAIQNILIPLMGEGMVTDKNTGETLYATDHVIFCTSNLSIETKRLHAIGFASGAREETGEEDLIQELSDHLLPEILGRFNGILPYNPLTLEAQWQVWSNLRHELAGRIGSGTRIVLNEDARRFVQDRFAVMETGARGIRDLFVEQVLPLSVGVSAGSTVHVGVTDARLTRESAPATKSAEQDT